MKNKDTTSPRINFNKFFFILEVSANFLASVSVLRAQSSQNTQMKPNIVFLIADDLGWNDVGFHGSEIRTPNIDALVTQGIELNRFYTCPVSSPTRAGLLTGRYPIRYGLMRSAIAWWDSFGLPTDEVLLPQVLAEAGYKNRGLIGKWHLGHSDLKYHPLHRGFNYFYGHYNGSIGYFTHERDGELDWHRNFESCYDKGYSTDLITSEAVKYIEEKSREGPFLCYVAFNAPHGPLEAPDKYLEQYRRFQNPEDKNARQIYAAMVSCMDDGIGKILNAIDRAGITNNTIVIFFSDNGATGRGSSNAPLRGLKATVFEGGIRVPAVIRWPARLKGGQKLDSVIAYIDIFPTLMRILDISDHGGKPFDGMDVYDVLTGKTTDQKREIFSYNADGGDTEEKISLSDAGWKLVCLGPNIIDDQYDDSSRTKLLFRIDRDPNETVNLWNENPEIGNKMLKRLKEYRSLQVKECVMPWSIGSKNFKPPPGYPPKEWDMQLFPK